MRKISKKLKGIIIIIATIIIFIAVTNHYYESNKYINLVKNDLKTENKSIPAIGQLIATTFSNVTWSQNSINNGGWYVTAKGTYNKDQIEVVIRLTKQNITTKVLTDLNQISMYKNEKALSKNNNAWALYVMAKKYYDIHNMKIPSNITNDENELASKITLLNIDLNDIDAYDELMVKINQLSNIFGQTKTANNQSSDNTKTSNMTQSSSNNAQITSEGTEKPNTDEEVVATNYTVQTYANLPSDLKMSDANNVKYPAFRNSKLEGASCTLGEFVDSVSNGLCDIDNNNIFVLSGIKSGNSFKIVLHPDYDNHKLNVTAVYINQIETPENSLQMSINELFTK